MPIQIGKLRYVIKQRVYAYSFLVDALWNNPLSFFALASNLGHIFALF